LDINYDGMETYSITNNELASLHQTLGIALYRVSVCKL